MKSSYLDIYEMANKAGITGGPKWHDENGVPRYCVFHPSKIANIYAKECALIAIECQFCKHKFNVAISNSDFECGNLEFEYGDPPNINCCVGGPATTAVPIKILEYHKRIVNSCSWERDLEVENKDIYPEWMK